MSTFVKSRFSRLLNLTVCINNLYLLNCETNNNIIVGKLMELHGDSTSEDVGAKVGGAAKDFVEKVYENI